MHWPTEVELEAPAAVPTIHAGIAGLGSYLPPVTLTSEEIGAGLGLEEGWIERRTGIRSRRRAAPGQRVTDLAAEAARAALEDAGVDAGEVDMVLIATLTSDEPTPNAAPQVAHAIGATRAGAMDVGAACAGFVSALTLGAALIESRRARNVLVIGAEHLSRFLDPTDRSTSGLFGDGAGAVLLTPREDAVVGASVLGSDGAAAPFIIIPQETGRIYMDGHETFKRAVRTLVSNTVQTVAANGLELEDIDLFVVHQANGRIVKAVREGLGVDESRVIDVIGDVGNTSAASIPLALAAAREQGVLHDGARVLLSAVGAGFTWAGIVVEWGAA